MLRDLWNRCTGRDSGLPTPHNVVFSRFEITAVALAEKLLDWRQGRALAERAVSDYLRDFNKPLLFGDQVRTYYTTDENGVIDKISFAGYQPPGWEAQRGTHDNWLVPQTAAAKAELAALPRMRTMKELAGILNWPHFEDQYISRPWREYARRVNSLPRVTTGPRALFVELPHPDNFAACPQVERAIRDWDPPAGLERVADGIKARRFDFKL